MGHSSIPFARILPVFHKILPGELLDAFWREAQPRAYHYKVKPLALVPILMHAYITRAPSTESILERYGVQIGTRAKSTLSEFLANPVFCLFTQKLLDHFLLVTTPDLPVSEHLVPLDSMTLSLQATARSDAPSLNNNTIGLGLTWALDLNAQPGRAPFQILKVHSGIWNDAGFLATEEAEFQGYCLMIYTLDRGFSGHRPIETLLKREQHFLLRLRKHEVKFLRLIETMSEARRHGSLQVVMDGVVEIGKQCPVQVRLVWVTLPGGEHLIVATDQMEWSLGKILESYRQRWAIEPMHKVLKDTIGLSHLYSLQESGMKALLNVVLLLAGLLWVGLGEAEVKTDKKGGVSVVASIREKLKKLRKLVTGSGTWKRNTPGGRWKKKGPGKAAKSNSPGAALQPT